MNQDISNPDPNLSDDSDNADESDMDYSSGSPDAEFPVVPDAIFHSGVDVPPALHVTSYLHFHQQAVLHKWFMKVFRNCSFMSSCT
jgi:hypothetical protein